MQRLTILGSTGSIGKNTLSVIQQYPDQFKVFALGAKSNVAELMVQCLQYRPDFAVMYEADAASQLRAKLAEHNSQTEVLDGLSGLIQIASDDDCDVVVAAIVGGIGLSPTFAAVKKGKRILLANKEALVMSGSLFMKTALATRAELLPVDSEHNAIFQCMPGEYTTGTTPQGVRKIILTASGGPFRNLPLDEFSGVTPEMAIAHPNWVMGAKISVDSATMMNKGLEVIEAYWLFNLPLEQIEVVVHPQSIIHSFVEYEDGSLLAQLGVPDMRIPIASSLSWPKRIASGANYLDLLTLTELSFQKVDELRFPALNMAYAALRAGPTATISLNAGNEVAVDAFLHKKISFSSIHEVVNETLCRMSSATLTTIEEVLEYDAEARVKAGEVCHEFTH